MSIDQPKWEPRSRADCMLRGYLRRERRSDWLGAVHDVGLTPGGELPDLVAHLDEAKAD